MKGMKKIVSVMLVLAMLAIFAAGCGGEGGYSFEDKLKGLSLEEKQTALVLSDATGKPGETVKVSAYLCHNPGICGYSFCMKQPEGFSVKNEQVTMKDNSYSYTKRDTDGNGINFAWTNLTACTDDRVIAECEMTIPSDAAAGEYEVQLIFRANYDMFYTVADDGSMPQFDVKPVTGTITVE